MNKKIVVIDDSPPIPKAIKIILSKEGFDVITANDGDEGYKKIVDEKPDLIISDIGMPKLSGYELLTWVRKNTETASIPFIFLTGEASDIRHDVDADGWLSKPFSKQSVLEAVNAVLKL
jgi:DNA-binding response OmpR family regulator